MNLTLERRQELRQQRPANGGSEEKGMVIVQKRELVALLDALDTAERERDEARADKADAYSFAAIYMQQAETAERERDQLRREVGGGQ